MRRPLLSGPPLLTHQLPGYSPLRLRDLAAGFRGALRADDRGPGGLREFLGRRYAAPEVALTGSGTQALRLALEICRDLPGVGDRPVALPAYSCFDLAAAAVGAGVSVAFYDIDPQTLAPEPESLARIAELRPSAIVAGNLYGFPLDWDLVRGIADRVGAILIEDAAQGLGSVWRGLPGGMQGDLTVFSFGRGKGWTGGGGGALAARVPALAATLRAHIASLPSPGWRAETRTGALLAAQWVLGRPSLYGLPMALPGTGLGETRYRHPAPPVRIGRVMASVVLSSAPAAAAEVARRAENVSAWMDRIAAGCPPAAIALCQPGAGGTSSYLRLPFLVRDAGTAADIARRGRRYGIGRGYPAALPELEQLVPGAGTHPDTTPGAGTLARRLLTLPTHSRVTGGDMDRICVILGAATSSRR